MLILEVVHFQHVMNVHSFRLHLTFYFHITCLAVDMNPNVPCTVRTQLMISVVTGKSMRDGKMSVPSSVTQLQINLRIIIGRLPQEPMTHNVKLLSHPPPSPTIRQYVVSFDVFVFSRYVCEY